MAITKKIAIHIFFFLIFATTCQAQTLKAYENAAETAFIQKNYFAAIEYFNILLEIEPQNPHYRYKYAEAARGFDAYELADTTYRKIRLEADSIYPLATYWEAKMKQRMGKYVPAQMVFEYYLANHSSYDPKFTKLAQSAIKDIDWAIEKASEPDEDLKLVKLSDNINSDYSEFAPSQDGDKVYYSSFNNINEKDEYRPLRQFTKVFVSEKEKHGEWLGGFNDEMRLTAHHAFNSDSTKIYFTLCDYVTTAEIRCELYSRILNPDGSYGAPEKLPSTINIPNTTTTQPNIGVDSISGKELLFFSSDRKGGKGGLDLWYSIIDNDTFSDPFNLENINSTEDEITPFFHSNSQTLYFSTNGFVNLGGYDVFKTKKDKNTWVSPTNLGAPINSSYNDTHFWMNAGEMFSLFSSNRLGSNYLEEEKEACCYDIYRCQVTVINLMAFTFNKKDESSLVGARMTLYELLEDGTLVEIDSRINEKGNEFDWKLETGKEYVIKAEREDFLTVLDTIDLSNPNLLSSKILERNLFLEPEALEFIAYTYDNDTKEPLPKVTLQLFKNGEEEDLVTNETGNEFPFVFERDQTYKIIASRPGWFPDTLVLDMKEMGNPLIYKYDFYLQEKSIQDIVPLILYFDNDRPNPKTMRTTSDKTYSETANAYYQRKPIFIDEYAKALEGRDRFLAENRLEAFFEREVKDGDENLVVFSYKLVDLLEAGQVIKIYIKGYASPRAGAEYNFNLGRRRVDCIRNQFDTYNGGVFQRFLNRGQLSIEEISFGSSKAPERLMNKLSDDKESVFGILASRERRVEIVGIRLDNGKDVIDTVKSKK